MRTKRHWRIIGWIGALVLCSGAIGATAALRVQNQRLARVAAGGGLPDLRVDRLTEVLELDSRQQEAVRAALGRGQDEVRAIAESAAAQAAQVARRLDEEIRPLLSPEQLRRYDRLGEIRQRIRERLNSGERLTPEQRDWLRERIEQRHGTRPRGEGRRP